MLLTQLSERAQDARLFDDLFPTLQLIHEHLGRLNAKLVVMGSKRRNLEKVMSRMSLKQLMAFVQRNRHIEPALMQLPKQLGEL